MVSVHCLNPKQFLKLAQKISDDNNQMTESYNAYMCTYIGIESDTGLIHAF